MAPCFYMTCISVPLINQSARNFLCQWFTIIMVYVLQKLSWSERCIGQAMLLHRQGSGDPLVFFFCLFLFFNYYYYFLLYLYCIYFIIFYCSGFCHTLKWNSHGFTCVPHPDPPSHLPLHPIPLGLPSAPGPSACLMHPTWAGDLFHPR